MSLANFSRWPGVSKKTYTQQAVGSFAASENAPETTAVPNDIGTLIVIVMKAKNLHNRRAISKQNPYCSVRVARHSDRTKAILRGGQAPVWDHEVRFKLSGDDDNNYLKLCVFDQNGSSTEIIGDTQIALRPAFRASTTEGYDDWFPIYYNQKYVGEVYLEMTFYPRRHLRDSRRSSTTSVSSSTQLRPSRSTTSVSSSQLSPSRSSASMRSQLSPSRSNTASVPPPPAVPPHLSMRHSESMPSLFSHTQLPHSGSMPSLRLSAQSVPSVPSSTVPRGRPLPQPPSGEDGAGSLRAAPLSQEEISKLINDGYEASLLQQLTPW